MRYALVATTSWLLLVDLKSKQVQPVEKERPEYYGISWFPGDKELVLSHSGLDNASLVDIAAYAQSETGWLSKGGLSSRTFLSQPHQILCAPDGKVICANTGRNAVNIFDFKKPNALEEVGVSNLRWDRLSLDHATGDHINSVFLRDQQLYVVAHGHAHGSKILTFSYPDLELTSVHSLGPITGLHNIWVTNQGQKISCHSENGSVIDLDTQLAVWESGAEIYTRGLAATQDYVLIGESQKTGRDLRRSSLGGIWILDRKSWKPVDHIYLGPYGAVNEIRVLDVADDAHHGHAYTDLAGLQFSNCYTELSRSRLSASIAASAGGGIWSEFTSIFGSPTVLQNGAKKSSKDQLCLTVQKTHEVRELKFTYSLDDPFESHVSAIVGYRGNGADKYMVAFLLKSLRNNSTLSVWKNDGSEWIYLPDILIDKQPLAGEVRLTVSEDGAVLYIDSIRVLTCTAQTLELNKCDFGLGIRWIGSTIRVGGRAD